MWQQVFWCSPQSREWEHCQHDDHDDDDRHNSIILMIVIMIIQGVAAAGALEKLGTMYDYFILMPILIYNDGDDKTKRQSHWSSNASWMIIFIIFIILIMLIIIKMIIQARCGSSSSRCIGAARYRI